MASRSPTLAEVIDLALRRGASALRVALPGRIERYDAAKQLVDVQPLLRDAYVDPNGADVTVSLKPIPNVPLVFPGAGGFRVTFPIAVGDTVLLVFNDRSLDKWKSQGGEVDPVDLRRHALSDAVAIPGLHPFSAPWTGASTSSMTLGKDGGAQVEITPSDVLLAGGSSPVARKGDPVSVDLSGMTLSGTVGGSPATFTVGPGTSASGSITDGAPHVKA